MEVACDCLHICVPTHPQPHSHKLSFKSFTSIYIVDESEPQAIQLLIKSSSSVRKRTKAN